jgi:hypothetical protein
MITCLCACCMFLVITLTQNQLIEDHGVDAGINACVVSIAASAIPITIHLQYLDNKINLTPVHVPQQIYLSSKKFHQLN